MRESSKKSVITNLLWRAMERFGAQGITFVVSLVLARLLDPEVYGVLALVTVFTVLMEVFMDSGFGIALVQKKDADDLDFSTMFYFNIVFSMILYLCLFLAAPLIAAFYKLPELTALVRVMSLIVVISAVKNVQQAYVSRNMMFKKFFFSTLGGTLGAAVIGITMAYFGCGVWALVAQILFNNFVDTLILWLTVPWRPKWAFSWTRFRVLYSYGWKLLVSSLIYTLYGNLRQLLVGKLYTTESLAFYNQGEKLPSFFVNNINTAIDSVMLSTLSAQQEDILRVKDLTRRAIQVGAYVMWPLMAGFAACAEPLVLLVLTEKWLPCVPFLRVCCMTYAMFPIYMTNMNAIKALGHSDVILKLEIINKVLGFTVLMITMWFGPYVMAVSGMIMAILGQVINFVPNCKLLHYRVLEQLKDILPSACVALAMGVVVYAVTDWGLSAMVTLLIQVPLGVVLYVAGSRLFGLEAFSYLLNLIREFLQKRKVRSEDG